MLKLDLNIIWTFIDLAVIFLVLRHFLFRPVNQVLEKRQKMIQNDLQNAEHNKQQAQALKTSYEKAMQDIKHEEMTLLAIAKENAMANYHIMMEEAKSEVKQFRKEAERNVEEERQKALQNLQKNTADLVILAAQKVAEQQMRTEVNQHMIDGLLAEVGEQP